MDGQQRRKDPGELLAEACRSCLRSRGIGEGGFVLVGFSGGPDSSALAHALSRLSPEMGFTLELGYVDHGLRPRAELDREIELVREFSRRIGRPLHVSRLDEGRVKALQDRTKCGVEAAARELRRAALAALVPAGPGAAIALGHTRDDQAETMVMRFFCGSGIRGLRGMPETGRVSGASPIQILRPLLAIGKEEVYAYLRGAGIPWSTDSSNLADDYLRNRVRKALLPAAAGVFPGYPKALSSLRKKLLLLESYMDESASGLFIRSGDAWTASGEDFFSAHPAVRLHALEGAVSRLFPGRRFPFSLLERASRASKPDGGRERGIIVSGGGIRLRSDGKSVILEKHLVQGSKKGYFFTIDGPGLYGPLDGEFFELFPSIDPKAGPALQVLSFPATLRSARPLDRLECRGGTKLLSDIMREWGVAEDLRRRIAVIEDARGLACVFGGPFGYRNRYSERGFGPGNQAGPYLGLKVVQKGGMNGSE
jgi:tRNA(Ile)-lysidine synthase